MQDTQDTQPSQGHLIRPVAHIRTPYPVKFGVPRQPGLVDALEGVVEFEPEFRDADAVRGLETFDYVWLIWDFSQNHRGGKWTPTVRPPRLGGTRRMGVFATRSSFRPNDLALSCVKLARVEPDAAYDDGTRGPKLYVVGADMMDGTPVYDIKPYLPFSDSKPEAGHGWVEADEWHELDVVFAPELLAQLPEHLHKGAYQVLCQDPRPAHARVTSQGRDFWVTLENYDIHFEVEGSTLTVTRVVALTPAQMQRLRETGTIEG
jgi:tRNA (adenine37-N6)-methyltransferase